MGLVTYAIAAAGTGGHVYPGLAVGEALVSGDVRRDEVLFIGGSRLEATVYPRAGFPFLEVPVRGLQRSLTPSNLTLPVVVGRAVRRMRRQLASRGVRVLLVVGGYASVPAGWAARRMSIPVFVQEQNAEAGLANRLVARWAERVFGSFPATKGLPGAEWVGNPVRANLAAFSRPDLRADALRRYRLEPGRVTVGVFGGSLGAGVINRAILTMMEEWQGQAVQVVHLAGRSRAGELSEPAGASEIPWVVLDFEPEMQYFFAACDLVVARAGGAVAELCVTGTPSVLVPGEFGSGHHQQANAVVMAQRGAAVVIAEADIDRLGAVVAELASSTDRRRRMSRAAASLGRPEAARVIARAMRERHG
ncbi:MAG: UDP-N-acetylglucosamine--N-acetylmuramyl-(pentapeptide) pyrophosphoryl-undecaprenol N-acetylglucosamine transferase [Acidimicrobiia bacterium]